MQALRRLADRVVLVFDGDEAGQTAADRALELFLGHEMDVRVLTLPDGLDPCDFLLREGADAFRDLVDRAVDPLSFAIDRAAARFDLDSLEELAAGGRMGARRSSAGCPVARRRAGRQGGQGPRHALATAPACPSTTLDRRLKELQRRPPAEPSGRRAAAPAEDAAGEPAPADRPRRADHADPARATSTRSTASWSRSS